MKYKFPASIGNYRLIFLDFDGVVKDSVSVKTDAFLELFKGANRSIREKIREHHIKNGGVSRFDKIPLYLKWSKMEQTDENVNSMCHAFSSIVRDRVINSNWVPGVKSFLQNQKCIFVMVSATPQGELIDICQSLNIDVFFARLYGSPICKSDAIHASMIDYNVSHDDCVMIGDAMTDIKAAKDNNIDFILRRHKDNTDIVVDHDVMVIEDFFNISR